MELNDSVVVVTGAASGIGRATAQAFARRGSRVHLVDLDGPGVEVAASAIRADGGRAAHHVVDCTDGPAVQALAEEVVGQEGRVDVLHNNAGVCCGGPVESIPLEDWHWAVDANLWTVVHGVRAFVPHMIARRRGHVVNTASMAGLVGLPMVAPYCAAKFAVVGLSEALQAELAIHGIRVTVVCPGSVRTNVMRNARISLPGDMAAQLVRSMDRKATRPEVIAERVVAAVRTGRSYDVPGGEMLPLLWLKGASVATYHRVTRLAATLMLRRLERR